MARQSAATFSAAPVAGCVGQGSGSSPTPGRIARDEIRRVDGSVQNVGKKPARSESLGVGWGTRKA